MALPILAGLGYGLWSVLEPREERGALIALAIAACGVLLPILLVAFGLDYLAPRNLVAAMIPVSALIAVVVTARRAGRVGTALAALIAVAGLAITIDVDLSPRLQRGDWRGVAKVLRRGAPAGERVITTVELGAAPLEYYLPPLHNLAEGTTVQVREIDETGYSPLTASAGSPPAPGFRLREPRRRERPDRLSLRLADAAHGLRGDAAPARDHRSAPRGAGRARRAVFAGRAGITRDGDALATPIRSRALQPL